MSIFQKYTLASIKQDESLISTRWAVFQNFKSKIDAIRGLKVYLSSVLHVSKIHTKLYALEKLTVNQFQTTLTKVKVDMKDIPTFQGIKQLYEEMTTFQREIARMDAKIDNIVGGLHGI
ncbi:hypothetical protein [Sulfuricurvum sp.]|uniref:hypothetical protein n=1 Tax=Sulfuricurvum sp. TaxID=2025608 RepID=UPI00260B7E34|nr:hypothetical protein [Sulfuricurvum sp.]MDD4884041.1 hypothetical protein [Sulfuricurvum sp.]